MTNARNAVLEILEARAPDATVCPSEVARALSGAAGAAAEVEWRMLMPAGHAAVDLLASDGRVRLSWKGKELGLRGGPYRIGRGEHR